MPAIHPTKIEIGSQAKMDAAGKSIVSWVEELNPAAGFKLLAANSTGVPVYQLAPMLRVGASMAFI
jgi:hypothetical protein